MPPASYQIDKRPATGLFDRHEKIKILLLYAFSIVILYLPVIFGGRSLQPSLFYTHGVTEKGPYGYPGRRIVNTFNIEMTQAYYVWPINKLVGSLYLNGELPLWNPYQAAGIPLAAQYSTRVFFPYQIIEDVCPVWSWDYFILGRLLVAGFFTYLFLRLLALCKPAAFLGGATYMFAGPMTWYINKEDIANGAMMLPVLLYLLERQVQNNRYRDIAFSGIAFGLVILAGQPQAAIYILLLAVLYFTFRVVVLFRQIRMVLLRLYSLPVAFIIGLGLSLPLVLLFMEFYSYSFNTHTPSYKMGIRDCTPLKYIIALVVPTFHQIPTNERIFPDIGVWDQLGGYIGVLPLYLAGMGVLASLGKRKDIQCQILYFFCVVGLVIVLKNFGVFPFYLMGYLPLFNQAWSQMYAGDVFVFCFAVSAAIGYEILSKRVQHAEGSSKLLEDLLPRLGEYFKKEWVQGLTFGVFVFAMLYYFKYFIRKYLRSPEDVYQAQWLALQTIAIGFFIVIGILVVILYNRKILSYVQVKILSLIALFMALMVVNISLMSDHYLALTEMQRRFFPPAVMCGESVAIMVLGAAVLFSYLSIKREGGFLSFIPLGLAELWYCIPRGYNYQAENQKLICFIIGLFVALALVSGRTKWVVVGIATFILSFFLIDMFAHYGYPDRYNPFIDAPYAKYLKDKNDGRYRVVAGDGVLFPNFASAMGICDVRYISSMNIRWYQDYVMDNLWIMRPSTAMEGLWYTGRPEFRYMKVKEHRLEEDFTAKQRLYSLLGVKYVITPSNLDTTWQIPTADDNNENNPEHKLNYLPLVYHNEVNIYENPKVLPRTFITHNVEFAGSYQEAQRCISSKDFDLRNTVVLDEKLPEGFSVKGLKKGISTAVLKEYRANKVVIDAQSESPGILVLTDTYYPGWEAYVDGKPTKIYRVDGVIRGVAVNEGHHTVEFRYMPKSFTTGLWVAAVSAFVCLVLVMVKQRAPGVYTPA